MDGAKAKAGAKPKYANFQNGGAYTLSAPRIEDPSGEEEVKIIAVPELRDSMKLFLWNNPTKECWESLFIDGTREKDGVQISKNWMQEILLSALDFNGSPLHQMLEGAGALDDLSTMSTGQDAMSEFCGDDDGIPF
jgi:hypothetical protein